MTALVPPGVVTVTSTAPCAPPGAVALMEPPETTVKLVAFAAPNRTAVAPASPVPVIVTMVPPVVGPVFGLIDVTAGTGGGAAT